MKIIRPTDHIWSELSLSYPSIFLVGPTPRSEATPSWRPAAIDLLEKHHYSGQIIVPEPFCNDYQHQIEWEDCGLTHCSAILCWIPRDLETLPGYTSNFEMGFWLRSQRLFYGRPDNSPSTKYLDYMYTKYTGMKPHRGLESLVGRVLLQLHFS